MRVSGSRLPYCDSVEVDRGRPRTAFLTSLVLSTLLLAYKVLLRPSPYTLIQFILYGLLLVALVTLILFFATGVYSEKIAYAHKCVAQFLQRAITH